MAVQREGLCGVSRRGCVCHAIAVVKGVIDDAASVVADMLADAAELRGMSHDVLPADYSNKSMPEAV